MLRAEAGQSGADRQRLRYGLSSLSIGLPVYFILNIFFIYSPPCNWQMYMEEWGQQKLHDMKEKILKHEIYRKKNCHLAGILLKPFVIVQVNK